MRPYNVEIFDRNINLRSYYEVNAVKYKCDYMDPEKNKVKVPVAIDCKTDDYIWITRGAESVFGIVSGISDKDNGMREISYQDFAQLFDVSMQIDTALIGQGYLESYVASMIGAVYSSNSDSSQNIPGVSFDVTPSVDSWTLNIDPDSDESTYAVVNLFDDIILPAFKAYEIVVTAKLDIMEKEIVIDVSRNDTDKITIEADLINVLSKEISIRKIKKEINKLIVINKKAPSMVEEYYLHSDGTYDQTDTDRLVPVKYKMTTVSTKTATEYEEAKEKEYRNAISSLKRMQDKSDELDEKDEEKIEKNVASLNEVPGIALAVDADGNVTGFDEEACTTLVDTYVGTYQYVEDCTDFAEDAMHEKALKKAESTFAANKYEDLIELEIANDDAMVKPEELRIGQQAEILHEGTSYNSILSGWEKDDTTTLIFGNIRLELTKMLKGRS